MKKLSPVFVIFTVFLLAAIAVSVVFSAAVQDAINGADDEREEETPLNSVAAHTLLTGFLRDNAAADSYKYDLSNASYVTPAFSDYYSMSFALSGNGNLKNMMFAKTAEKTLKNTSKTKLKMERVYYLGAVQNGYLSIQKGFEEVYDTISGETTKNSLDAVETVSETAYLHSLSVFSAAYSLEKIFGGLLDVLETGEISSVLTGGEAYAELNPDSLAITGSKFSFSNLPDRYLFDLSFSSIEDSSADITSSTFSYTFFVSDGKIKEIIVRNAVHFNNIDGAHTFNAMYKISYGTPVVLPEDPNDFVFGDGEES